jgi:hypothetical protein
MLLRIVCRSVAITLTPCLATFAAQAALLGRAPLTPGGTDYQAYYDTDTDLTWVADANLACTQAYALASSGSCSESAGLMNWPTAMGWAASLNAGPGYLGATGWRLPTVTDTGAPGCNFSFSGTDCGENVDLATGEMARMFYGTLGNTGGHDTSGTLLGCSPCLTNAGPFSNLLPLYYWSGTEELGSFAWDFTFWNGSQLRSFKSGALYAWAVRSGDIAAVPAPTAIWLLGTGLVGLGSRRWLRRKITS